MKLDNIPKVLLVKIKATHYNFINKNNLLYTKNAITNGAKSWIHPFQKPQLVAHDTSRDPIGRIIDFKIIDGSPKNNEPQSYIELTSRITDPDSIQKILDGRYTTGSVGSSSSKVICSECKQVITRDGLCSHKKGTYNDDGELIYWIIDQIGYTENSFVNEPADEYAIIDKIYIGGDWVNFTNFSDSREDYLSLIDMEDSMACRSDAKLSADQRKKLPESAFCGPDRTFPAHDKEHVVAGLGLLDSSKFSEPLKNKILADLYRKGKKYGINYDSTDLGEGFDILYRLDDAFSDEELKEIDTWFKSNPDSDLPIQVVDSDQGVKITDSTENIEEKDISKMKRDELVEALTKLQKKFEDAKVTFDKSDKEKDVIISELQDKVKTSEAIAYEKEDSLNKYVDKVCILEKKYKDSVISNIIDLKLTDNNSEVRETLANTFAKRTVDSLEDSLNDLRIESLEKAVHSEDRVNNPTIEIKNTDQSSGSHSDETDSEETSNPRFKIFSVDRRKMEAE